MSRAALRFVAWSLALCIVCTGAYILIFPVVITPLQPLPNISAWLIDRIPRWTYNTLTRLLSSAAIFSFFAAMTAALVAGPRALRARLTRRGVALTVCGLLLAAIYCGGPMLWYARSRQALDALGAEGKARLAEMRERLESGSVPESRREQVWLLYARTMYRDEGARVGIPDASGRLVPYEPTESDIADRRFYVKLLEDLRPPTDHLKGSAFWVGLCLAVGLLTPLRWPRKPAGAPGNQGANPGTGALAEE